jgi:hypothetical protein
MTLEFVAILLLLTLALSGIDKYIRQGFAREKRYQERQQKYPF